MNWSGSVAASIPTCLVCRGIGLREATPENPWTGPSHDSPQKSATSGDAERAFEIVAAPLFQRHKVTEETVVLRRDLDRVQPLQARLHVGDLPVDGSHPQLRELRARIAFVRFGGGQDWLDDKLGDERAYPIVDGGFEDGVDPGVSTGRRSGAARFGDGVAALRHTPGE